MLLPHSVVYHTLHITDMQAVYRGAGHSEPSPAVQSHHNEPDQIRVSVFVLTLRGTMVTHPTQNIAHVQAVCNLLS